MSKEAAMEKKKPNLRFQRDKDRERVKGMFQFHECPGGKLEFVFRMYKEDPVEYYSLQDGQYCELPLGVARHLNQNGWYPVHRHQLDSNGKAVTTVGEKRHRYSFRSLEFMGPEDLKEPSDIVTVSYNV